ncbi:histidine biosynthesis trifunctional protein [Scheffersomyces xylosifermentans]|uniref:histidine biosynthesis trifunctional protein n=1 Tax=Scheffersomyces xylosifermentans TaxID=1304137 RepID=UPI00315DBBB6
MTFPVLPVLASPQDSHQIADFSVVGQFVVPFKSVNISKQFLQQFPREVSVDVDATADSVSVDQIVELLNNGIRQVFINESQVEDAIFTSGLPSARFAIEFESDNVSAKILETAASFVFKKPLSKDDFKKFSSSENRTIYVKTDSIDQEAANKLAVDGYFPVIDAKKLTSKQSESGKVSISELFTSTLSTDRPDGLFTTLITTPAPSYSALGVVYSSKASIQAAIAEKVGVYQSRKRTEELWYKGKTSGATQKLVKLEKDCDSDVVKFIVDPRDGYGFCHLDNNFTCFRDGQLKQKDESFGSGLSKLDNTLAKRFESAPEGSYTKRLFNDEDLLIAKLKEELDELIEAGQNKTKDSSEVAWECADLFYFAMVWCIKNGVRLADVEKNLDIKAGKVTRRKGDAKAAYVQKKVPDAAKPEPASAIEESYKMEIINANDSANAQLIKKALTRPVQKTADIMKLVLPIVQQVQKDGDKALIELTAKFDGVKLDSPVLNAPFPQELMNISDDMKKAIDLSISNIEKFHAAQLPKEKVMTVETAPGVRCSRFAKPIENVGLYVPGGTAVLPSTAMMLGVPAKVAGCSNIIVASPPARATGKLTPEVVYVAHKIGAKCIVMAGGAQAVTAMAYGTESVLKCDKILGPGNQFVTAAKMHVQNDTQALCSIDMPAGPSEVLVIADENADADFVASDLLSQAEHGVDSQVILIGVGLSKDKLNEFEAAVKKQAEVLPRKEIVAKCLAHSYILLVDTYEEAFDLSNKYAPEHLILQIDDAPKYVPDYVENAGSVFVGALSPESCGDYSSGTNHTLPTYGYARQYSGVNTATFQKFITSQDVSEEGLKSIGKAVMTLAAVEGLEAHRNAVQVRMDKLGLL